MFYPHPELRSQTYFSLYCTISYHCKRIFIIEADGPNDVINIFEEKVLGMTNVRNNIFGQLKQSLEEGLSTLSVSGNAYRVFK